jgi:Xaa-Pro aminopeptidase
VRNDLERLMAERGMDVVVVMGPSAGNPNLFYSVSGAGLTSAIYLKRRGEEPHLVYNPMERDQARATGIDGSSFADNDITRFQEEAGGDGIKAQAAFLAHLLKKHAVQGRVGFYGTGEVSRLYPILKRLTLLPGVELYEEANGKSLFDEARLTKESSEVERMRRVALACFAAYDAIKMTIRAGRLVDGRLQHADGSPVTIGVLRNAVRAVFAAHGVVEDHDSIIAQGVDGTAPHNHGTDSDVLREGASIVVDIFPREPGGGYFFDITRTFCVGAAPARLREVYSQVKEVLFLALAELKVGERCVAYQERACQRFEAMGYSTIRQDPRLESGYVHGLGHGVGLDLHEAPRLGGATTNRDVIQPGMVFTVEPGLYLPDEEIAVRLEDVVWVHPDGSMENLSPYSYDLEVFPGE